MAGTMEAMLALYRNAILRIAIRNNFVTFPAQVPAFMKQPAGRTQQRVVQLYFVRGWSVRNICDRYGLGKKIVQNLLSDWRVRAVAAGLIQEIEPEPLATLARQYEAQDGEVGPDAAFLKGADIDFAIMARNS